MNAIHRLLAGLPFDEPSRRALGETFCDWEHEAAAATGARRIVVFVRSIAGVLRTIVTAVAFEISRIPSGWLLPRLGGLLVLPVLLLAGLGWGHVAAPVPAMSDRWLELTTLALPQAAVALLPLALFIVAAGVTARVTARAPARPLPAVGLAVAASLAVLALSAWVLPAAGWQFHVSAYALSSGLDPTAAAERLRAGPGDLPIAALVAQAIERPWSPAMGVLLFRTGLAALAATFTLWGSALSRAAAPLRPGRLGTVIAVYAIGVALLPSQWELGAHAPALVGLIPWLAAVVAIAAITRLTAIETKVSQEV